MDAEEAGKEKQKKKKKREVYAVRCHAGSLCTHKQSVSVDAEKAEC